MSVARPCGMGSPKEAQPQPNPRDRDQLLSPFVYRPTVPLRRRGHYSPNPNDQQFKVAGVFLFDPHLAAITDSQPHNVVAPERALAPHTAAPTDLPDHARRVSVHVQHGFAPGATVPCPRLRLAETCAVLRCGAVVGAATPARVLSRVLLPRLCWLSGCIFTPPRAKPCRFIARHTAADRWGCNGTRSTTCLDATL